MQRLETVNFVIVAGAKVECKRQGKLWVNCSFLQYDKSTNRFTISALLLCDKFYFRVIYG